MRVHVVQEIRGKEKRGQEKRGENKRGNEKGKWYAGKGMRWDGVTGKGRIGSRGKERIEEGTCGRRGQRGLSMDVS